MYDKDVTGYEYVIVGFRFNCITNIHTCVAFLVDSKCFI